MLFHSTKNPGLKVSLKQAVLSGLAPDGGLYVPEQLPIINKEELNAWTDLPYCDLSFELAKKWYGDDIPALELKTMIDDSYSFQPVLKKIKDDLSVLELFHGPTLSFKDFGARMLAQIMSYFAKQESKTYTILTATSGDTGSAVASAFHGLDNIKVIILYPQGKVSPFQESQMLSFGDNIKVYALDGTFDDCQRNVKQAFKDPDFKSFTLTSANSINIGRLIPQSWYYFYASLNNRGEGSVDFSIPSGNFGNLTACLIAKLMGAPIRKIIAGTNANCTVPDFLKSGVYRPRPSVETLSNAMDVGNPSNWERITHYLSSDIANVRKFIWAVSKTDSEIKKMIKKAYKQHNYLLDPHGAVAFSALLDYQTGNDSCGVALMTGSPYKYRKLLEKITGNTFSKWPKAKLKCGKSEVITRLSYSLIEEQL